MAHLQHKGAGTDVSSKFIVQVEFTLSPANHLHHIACILVIHLNSGVARPGDLVGHNHGKRSLAA